MKISITFLALFEVVLAFRGYKPPSVRPSNTDYLKPTGDATQTGRRARARPASVATPPSSAPQQEEFSFQPQYDASNRFFGSGYEQKIAEGRYGGRGGGRALQRRDNEAPPPSARANVPGRGRGYETGPQYGDVAAARSHSYDSSSDYPQDSSPSSPSYLEDPAINYAKARDFWRQQELPQQQRDGRRAAQQPPHRSRRAPQAQQASPDLAQLRSQLKMAGGKIKGNASEMVRRSSQTLKKPRPSSSPSWSENRPPAEDTGFQIDLSKEPSFDQQPPYHQGEYQEAYDVEVTSDDEYSGSSL